jgi:hypothetical protein
MNAGVWTYSGFIGYCGFDDYPVPTTYTRYFVITAPYTGSIGVLASNLTTNNFSRPSAGTIDGGRALLSTLDNSIMRLAASAGSFSQVNSVSNNAYGNGYTPAAMVAGGTRLAVAARSSIQGADYIRDVWIINESGGASIQQQSYTFGYQTWLCTVIQQGVDSTQSVWVISSFPFSGTNYVQVIYYTSGAGITNLYPSILANCLVDGFNATSRIVNYGA